MIFDSLPGARAVGRAPINIGPKISADILRIVDAGWREAAASSGLHAGTHEVPMTWHLRQGMIAALDREVVPSSKKMTVLPGTEPWSPSPPANQVGLTDISIHLQTVREKSGDHDPHAVVECKRIAGTDRGLCVLYVSEGIDRFSKPRFPGRVPKYSGRHGTAFMVGYLISGSADSATNGINGVLSQAGRKAECLLPCTVLDESWARTSRHLRPTLGTLGAPLDLHHAFLGFHGSDF